MWVSQRNHGHATKMRSIGTTDRPSDVSVGVNGEVSSRPSLTIRLVLNGGTVADLSMEMMTEEARTLIDLLQTSLNHLEAVAVAEASAKARKESRS